MKFLKEIFSGVKINQTIIKVIQKVINGIKVREKNNIIETKTDISIGKSINIFSLFFLIRFYDFINLFKFISSFD